MMITRLNWSLDATPPRRASRRAVVRSSTDVNSSTRTVPKRTSAHPAKQLDSSGEGAARDDGGAWAGGVGAHGRGLTGTNELVQLMGIRAARATSCAMAAVVAHMANGRRLANERTSASEEKIVTSYDSIL